MPAGIGTDIGEKTALKHKNQLGEEAAKSSVQRTSLPLGVTIDGQRRLLKQQ